MDTNTTLPIALKDIVQLTNIGFDASSIKLGVLSFESDKYICAKEVIDGNASVVTCDIEKNFTVSKKKIVKAEALMMHPTKNILAVRAKNERNSMIIQVYNLDTQEKLKDIVINYEVVYWKWITETIVGLVTSSSALALSIDDVNTPAKKLFDRSGAMANQNVFVMNLTCDSNLQWYALSAIAPVRDQTGKTTINGHIQLYYVASSQTQAIEGFCAVFGNLKVIDDTPSSTLAFIDKKANDTKYNLVITDISPNKKYKFSTNIQFGDTDVPVLLNFVENYGLIFTVTNGGYLYVFEVSKGNLLIRCKISEDPLLFCAKNTKTGGVYYINKSGKLILINIDENNLIPYLMTCSNVDNLAELCLSMASRYSLPGAEKIFVNCFKNYMQSGQYAEAVKICIDSPGDILRNLETITLFRNAPGNPQPILVYFQKAMEKGKLNNVETIEIVKPLVQQNKRDFIIQLFTEGKLTSSEELAEIVKVLDPNLSLRILVASGSASAHGKVIEGLAITGQTDKIFQYCQQNSYKPDWVTLLRNLVVANPESAVALAKSICNRQNSVFLVDVNTVIEIFHSRKRVQELTTFLLEYLKDNRPEDSFLQTKLLELNLYESPKATQMILEKNIFSYYDKQKIASLCEKIGLLQISLDNYTDINDIKRVLLNAHLINPNYIVEYLGRLSPENILICLHELLRSNPMNNINVVIEASVKYVQRIPIPELVKLYETYGNFNGLFVFISRIVNMVNDPEIMFKYICAGVITNNFNEVQRVIRDYDNYDPAKVLEFFLEKKLADIRPLILLCDKHEYVEQLTLYLYKNKQTKALEQIVLPQRPNFTPKIVGTLLDEECQENYIKQILNTVKGNCPIDQLVEEVEKRQKLKILQKYLEERADEGNQNPSVHNSLAKIYIETNNNAKDFLMNNKFFDPKIVGNYCEDRDPHLALLAYKKAGGKCDDELIYLTNKNAMYRAQAQYLVESLNPELWKKVLDSNNEHKKAVTDQVIQVILPVTRNPEEVSVTVKAFIDAGLQSDLMDLLEKLVLHNSEFAKNRSLQNLLILTAITADPKKVRGFLNRLDSYEGPDLAVKCLENSLFEEAYFIYDKVKDYSQAIEVIIKYIDDLKRATIYAEKINTPEVWSKIGRAKICHDIVDEAIEAFIKASDAEMYNEVIAAAERQGKFEDLVRYLQMARTLKKDKTIDCELVYSLSRCGKLADLEAFIHQTNISELGGIADRLYDEKFYEPCKILYEQLGNNARLASCFVHLKQYSQALIAAKKANSSKCWKEVCFACVKAGEYRLAAQAGNNIIQLADLVEELIREYEKWGAYMELIQLFEANLVGERNHINTELGVLYAKYLPEKLMDHCRNYHSNMNVNKVIRVCEQYYHWNEVVFLHNHDNGFDSALLTMIEHSPLCWKHDLFCQTLGKVTNSNLYSESIHFYILEQPQLLNDMLKVISSKLDLSTAVFELRKAEAVPLAVPFLKSVQSTNNFDVNEALNEIYVEEEDPESLKNSILEYSSFDQLNLAKKIQNHPLLEFRRISALVYRKNKKYVESIEISKKLEFYKDAIDTALESGKDTLVEELMRFFAGIGDKECFAACLYTCYEHVKPDIAMELAWRYDFTEFLMPYMIQTIRDLTIRMDHMQMKAALTEEKAKKEKDLEGEQVLDVNFFTDNRQMMIYGQPMPNQNVNPMGMYGGMMPPYGGGNPMPFN